MANSESFVLVHGAWMGAWCWSDVVAGLKAKGAKVATVELPGHGGDTTAIGAINLDAYVKKIAAAIDSVGGPVVLVGHSMAGVPITQTAELLPSKIAKLVYLAAYLPQNGEGLETLAMQDRDSMVGPNLDIKANLGVGGLPREKLKEIFCADCADEQTAAVLEHYRDEPLVSLQMVVSTTAANWGAVKKYYVFTKRDHAVTYTLQQAMAAKVKLTGSVTLDTSHAPFLSAPTKVVDALLSF